MERGAHLWISTWCWIVLNWTVGEMGPLQYWITPEDLAAKRFENTVLTIEAY